MGRRSLVWGGLGLAAAGALYLATEFFSPSIPREEGLPLPTYQSAERKPAVYLPPGILVERAMLPEREEAGEPETGPEYRFEGTIYDYTNYPVQGAKVSVFYPQKQNAPPVATATSDEKGEYRVEVPDSTLFNLTAKHGNMRGFEYGVIPGKEDIQISELPTLSVDVWYQNHLVPGKLTVDYQNYVTFSDDSYEDGMLFLQGLPTGLCHLVFTGKDAEGNDIAARVPFNIPRRDRYHEDIKVPDLVEVGFRVVLGSPEGEAIPGVPVVLKGNNFAVSKEFVSEKDPVTLYLSPGSYHASAEMDGFVPADMNFSFPDDAGDLIMFTAENIKGYVFDQEGSPLLGVRISLIDTPIAATTDQSGFYELGGLSPLDPDFNNLLFEREEYQPEVVAGVRVPRDNGLDVFMEELHELFGTVTADGEDVSNAKLTVIQKEGPLTQWMPYPLSKAETDAEGEYRIPVGEGVHLVSISAPGYQTWFGKLTIQGDTEYDIDLSRGVSLSGTVMLPGGRVLPGATIGINEDIGIGNSVSRFTRAGLNGEFTFSHLVSGEYTVLASAEGLSCTEYDVIVPQENFDFIFKGRLLEVNVRDRAGSPLKDVSIHYTTKRGEEEFQVDRRFGDELGRYQFLVGGELESLEVSAPGKEKWVREGEDLRRLGDIMTVKLFDE